MKASKRSLFSFKANRMAPVPLGENPPAPPRKDLMSASSDPADVPSTWQEYNQAYQNGEMDFDAPPLPPTKLDGSGMETSSGQYWAPAPQNEKRRQRAVDSLDLTPPKLKKTSKSKSRRTVTGEEEYAAAKEAQRSDSPEQPTVKVTPEDLSAYPALQKLAKQASRQFGSEVVTISLMDQNQQVFLAEVGLDLDEPQLARESTVCSHTMLKASTGSPDPLVVLDLAQDWRFKKNNFGKYSEGFYAALPIMAPAPFGDTDQSEYPCGIFCLLDSESRPDFTTEEKAQLAEYAEQASAEIARLQEEKRKKEALRLTMSRQEWKRKNKVVKKVASKTGLDTVTEVKTPPSSPPLPQEDIVFEPLPDGPRRPSLVRTLTKESATSSIVTTEIIPTFCKRGVGNNGLHASMARNTPDDIQSMLDLSTRLIGESLDLDFTYLLAIDIPTSSDDQLTSQQIRLLSSHNVPIPAPLFDTDLHVEILISNNNALLFSNPGLTGYEGEYSTGLLVRVCDHKGVGYVLGGFSESPTRVLNRQDFTFFRSFSADLRKWCTALPGMDDGASDDGQHAAEVEVNRYQLAAALLDYDDPNASQAGPSPRALQSAVLSPFRHIIQPSPVLDPSPTAAWTQAGEAQRGRAADDREVGRRPSFGDDIQRRYSKSFGGSIMGDWEDEKLDEGEVEHLAEEWGLSDLLSQLGSPTLATKAEIELKSDGAGASGGQSDTGAGDYLETRSMPDLLRGRITSDLSIAPSVSVLEQPVDPVDDTGLPQVRLKIIKRPRGSRQRAHSLGTAKTLDLPTLDTSFLNFDTEFRSNVPRPRSSSSYSLSSRRLSDFALPSDALNTVPFPSTSSDAPRPSLSSRPIPALSSSPFPPSGDQSRARTPSTDESMAARPTSAFSMTPSTFTSRFDPQMQALAKQELEKDRPVFANKKAGAPPKTILLPAPLAGQPLAPPPRVRVEGPESDSEPEDEVEAATGEGDDADSSLMQSWSKNRRPAGRLYGRSLMDVLADRKEANKAQQRHHNPALDGRRPMAEWSDSPAARAQLAASALLEPETLPRTKSSLSIFGPDLIYQRDMRKRLELDAIENAEREEEERKEAEIRERERLKNERKKLVRKSMQLARDAAERKLEGVPSPLPSSPSTTADKIESPVLVSNVPLVPKHTITPSLSLPTGISSSNEDWFKVDAASSSGSESSDDDSEERPVDSQRPKRRPPRNSWHHLSFDQGSTGDQSMERRPSDTMEVLSAELGERLSRMPDPPRLQLDFSSIETSADERAPSPVDSDDVPLGLRAIGKSAVNLDDDEDVPLAVRQRDLQNAALDEDDRPLGYTASPLAQQQMLLHSHMQMQAQQQTMMMYQQQLQMQQMQHQQMSFVNGGSGMDSGPVNFFPGMGMVVANAQFAALEALQAKGQDLMRFGLANVLRFNESQIERVMAPANTTLPPNDYAVDLTDDNYEAVLRTGTENPLAESLPDDTIWVVTIYGPDQFSKMFTSAFDAVAEFNNSAVGGALPPQMRFARLNYGTETVLSTKWWVWKVPMVVIATDKLQTLRFIKLGTIPPFHDQVSQLLAKREWWESIPVWKSRLAPGGAFEEYLMMVAKAWAVYHFYLSKIPTFVILMFSGMLMNVVVGFFHKDTVKPTETAEKGAAKTEKKALAAKDTPTASTGSSSVQESATKASKRK
ncbi:hypothetical protein MNV49_003928 [Pseudohyphozyma bogoriensis]|nr:hypothetical protein MNV49_003928 [Pseudohyphozyma bogoriensis]